MLKGRVDDRDAVALLRRLRAKVDNLRPEFQEIGAIGRRSMLLNFEVGGRYSEPGSWRGGPRKWEPLADSTLRGRNSRFDGKLKQDKMLPERRRRLGILLVAAKLRNSINYQADARGVEWGTNRPEAAIQNYGGQTGPHRITARHKKALSWAGGAHPVKSVNHPGSKIPARPFVVLQDEDLTLIKNLLRGRLLAQAQR